MRVNINTSDFKDISINVNYFNVIYAANGGGKTKLCRLLKDGFDGKLGSRFLFQGNEIAKNEFSVYYVADIDTLDIEKTLSSKSLLKGMLTNEIKDVEVERIGDLQKQIEALNEVMKNLILNNQLMNKCYSIDLEVDIIDYFYDYAKIKLKGKLLDEVSFTDKRMAYLELIIDNIGSIKRPTVLIVDEFDMALSEGKAYQLAERLSQLTKNNELIVFISSSRQCAKKSNSLYVLEDKIVNRLLDTDNVLQLMAKKENCTIEDMFAHVSDDEIDTCIRELINEERLELFFLNTSMKFNSFDDLWTCYLESFEI